MEPLVKIECPYCGSILEVYLDETGSAYVRHVDMENTVTIQQVRDAGMEFGQHQEK